MSYFSELIHNIDIPELDDADLALISFTDERVHEYAEVSALEEITLRQT